MVLCFARKTKGGFQRALVNTKQKPNALFEYRAAGWEVVSQQRYEEIKRVERMIGKEAKGLSVLEPWATLIGILAKRYETRSWYTPYRGLVLIHASASFHYQDKLLCMEEPFYSTLKAAGYRFAWDGRKLKEVGEEKFPLGAVVAVAELVDCILIKSRHHGPIKGELNLPPEEPEYSFGNYEPGRFAWILEDVTRLKVPVPCKGRLGLWEPDVHTSGKVLEQLQEKLAEVRG